MQSVKSQSINAQSNNLSKPTQTQIQNPKIKESKPTENTKHTPQRKPQTTKQPIKTTTQDPNYNKNNKQTKPK